MKLEEAQQSFRRHPVVVGARLDGSTVWVCDRSGNVIVQMATHDYNAAWERYQNSNDGSIPAPERRQRYLHPSLATKCDGITCQHFRMDQGIKARPYVLAIETLTHHQQQNRSREA